LVNGVKSEREQLADLIERFVSGNVRPHEWDDFLSVRFDDAELESIRRACDELPSRFPPRRRGEYCNDEGAAELLVIARRLREHPTAGQN